MPIHPFSRLRNPVLLLALAAAFPLTANAAGVASIDFSTGSVTALSLSGIQRPLGKGAEVVNGDTVRTGGNGRAQLRFSDGALISLQPHTEFRVDDYQYSGKIDGQEKGFFSLLKGGLRTITGWVRRTNRENYKVSTSVATIGIRGTEYSAGLNPSGSELNVSTGEGLVEVCNTNGCLLLASGESGFVQGANAPRRTDSRPQLLPAQPEDSLLPVYASGEDKNTDGSPESMPASAKTTPTPTPPPVLYTVGGIVGLSGGIYRNNATATFNGDGSLNSFTSGSQTSSQGTAQVVGYNGSDAIIKWGAWANGNATIDNVAVTLSANQSLHHFWGVPTATMPTTGTASYVLLGGTSPTEVSGAWAPGTLNSASMSVNFGTLAVNASLGVTINPGPYNTFNMSGSGSISGGNGIAITGMSGTGSGCVSGCSGEVSGRFFGTSAERAGITYKISEGLTSKTIIGVATLKQ